MKCPHLNRWIVATCKIDERTYAPSLFQLNEYCKTKVHKRCPFFVKNVSKMNRKKGASTPIPAGEYA
jgi:hypothetical protein